MDEEQPSGLEDEWAISGYAGLSKPPRQPLPRLCNYFNPDESYDDEMWSLKTTLLNASLCNLAWIIKPLSDFYGR